MSTSASPSISPTPSTAESGPITLSLPPIPTMVRVGRLTASSIASLADMTIDDIDDIKIAVSEMITVLIQSGSRAMISLRFETTATEFSVEASTPSGQTDLGRNDLALATAVLDAVADEHHVAATGDTILIRVVKRLSSVSATDAHSDSPS
jgi:anti-sigma regulatory factor (Ser/Thr protein kinase)